MFKKKAIPSKLKSQVVLSDKSKGGQAVLDNLQLLCRHCNRSKGIREMIKGG